jgi:hypothetical protein
MKLLTPPQVNWLYHNQPFIDHEIDGKLYDKITKQTATSGVNVYLDKLDYADLPDEFHQLAKVYMYDPPKNKHNLLSLFANPAEFKFLLIFAGMFCVLLAASAPYWTPYYGDWFAYIVLVPLSTWLFVKGL